MYLVLQKKHTYSPAAKNVVLLNRIANAIGSVLSREKKASQQFACLSASEIFFLVQIRSSILFSNSVVDAYSRFSFAIE